VVATLGPASWTDEMLPKMIEAGVNIFRLNCSHRRGGVFEEVYPRLRAAAAAAGKPVEVLGDLQGPKFRVAETDGEVITKKGDVVTVALCENDEDIIRNTENGVRITLKPTLEQTALLKGLTVGMEVLIEDGKRKLKVTERVSETEVKAEMLIGGLMKARQGVNVPDLEIDCAALTKKDVEDAEYLLQLEPPIEYIAVSFVQKGADCQELIDIMDRLNIPAEKRPKICPKIEKPQAMTNLEDIMSKSGALMVARGDLGVELGPERVPFAQKLMIKHARVSPSPSDIH
jgi:pyruvate kinase